MLINSSIPNTMSHKGLEHLARIASSASESSTILEAGSLYGCSAWVLSKNAGKNVKVIAIDPWEHKGFLNRFKINNLRVPDLSKHAFQAYTHDCENLTPIQGYSPQAAEGLDISNLDVVFEDAAHSYDILKQNVEYFFPKLNPGGIFCGDDYQSAFPGVIKCVDELAKSIGVTPQICGQVWAIRKPLVEAESDSDLYAKVGNLFDAEIGVKLTTVDDVDLVAAPHCFTPNLFHPEKLSNISLFWHSNSSLDDLDFVWNLKFADGTESGEKASGSVVDLTDQKAIAIKVSLKGKNKSQYLVGYQIAEATSLTAELNTLGPSRERFNGTWLNVTDATSSIYALSVGLVTPELRRMRSEHASLIKAGKEVGEQLYGDAGKKNKKK